MEEKNVLWFYNPNKETEQVSEIDIIILQQCIDVSHIIDMAKISCITNISDVETIWWTKTSEYYHEKFEIENLQGMSCPIDIYDCSLEKIQSKRYIYQYIVELCKWMWWDMVWKTYIKYFDNEDPGITFKQRTNQWLVSWHFKDNTNGACIDIHSRDFHDPNIVAEFSKRFFDGWKTELDVSFRYPESSIDETSPDIQTIWWKQSTNYYEEQYNAKNVWWMNAAVDIHNCDLQKLATQENIPTHDFIKKFILDLCDHIDMVRDGEPEVFDISHNWESWLEFTQVITTSLISWHFRYPNNRAYFEIFSCKFYDPNDVAEFTKKYFSGWKTQIQVSFRGIDG